MAKTLRLILGDQLNSQHSWLKQTSDDVIYFLCEMRQETDYVKHHVQKILCFFTAMRLFAEQLQDQGHQVIYWRLGDPDNQQSLPDNLKALIKAHHIEKLEYQYPDEYRLEQQLVDFCQSLHIETTVVDSEHFMTQRDTVAYSFGENKQPLMETFYRKMRRDHDILMDGDKPQGGQWNYDKSNRKALPKGQKLPEYPNYHRDISDTLAMLDKQSVDYFGRVNAEQLDWPLTRDEALAELNDFLKNRLKHFGDFQDAMTNRDDAGTHWLFHSRLSVALNLKLITPLEVVQAVEKYWREHQDSVDISQVEGFIRQIIGWREYMRGLYWWKMPQFAEANHFRHQRDLPDSFWNGKTDLACLSACLNNSLDNAYAHHIQRLMVIGNFALLIGCDPAQVDAWYLGVYADAIEWVQLPNTRGMSQYADGGVVASKPYVSSGNYINKMSDYCNACRYDLKQKTGAKACPFNYLYWDFIDRHLDRLENNHRMGLIVSQWKKREEDGQQAVRDSAKAFLKQLK